jgi:hypothetical protein
MMHHDAVELLALVVPVYLTRLVYLTGPMALY